MGGGRARGTGRLNYPYVSLLKAFVAAMGDTYGCSAFCNDHSSRVFSIHASDVCFCTKVPVGVPGRMWIAGPTLAIGYLNMPERTAERFVPDPFAAAAGKEERMYDTGDRCRYLPSGSIEVIGRCDFMVKVSQPCGLLCCAVFSVWTLSSPQIRNVINYFIQSVSQSLPSTYIIFSRIRRIMYPFIQ